MERPGLGFINDLNEFICNGCSLPIEEHNPCQMKACNEDYLKKLDSYFVEQRRLKYIEDCRKDENYYRDHSVMELNNREIDFILRRLSSCHDVLTPLNVSQLIKKLEQMKY